MIRRTTKKTLDVVGLLFLGISLALPGSAATAWPFTIESSSSDWVHASVAYNSQDHQYLVVFNDTWNVLGRLVSDSGVVVKSFWISYASSSQSADVAYNPNRNEYVVVWEHDDGIRPNIYSRALSAQGAHLGNEETLGSGPALRSRTRPVIAYSQVAHKYLVVFESVVQASITGDIEAQLLSDEGAKDGVNYFIVQGSFSTSHSRPAVTYNRSRNEFLVVWQYATSGNNTIRGRRVQGNGALMYPESVVIASTSEQELVPDVAAIPTAPNKGQYLVVYQFGSAGSNCEIYGRSVDGELNVGSFVYPATGLGDQMRPAVAGNEASDEFLVVWTEPDGAVTSIQGQLVALDGSLVGPRIYLDGFNADNAAVASSAGSTLLVAYDALVWPSLGRDIFGRFVGGPLFSDGFESGSTGAWSGP